MKSGKPNFDSGKTQFKRQRQKGKSWVLLRAKAEKEGRWKHTVTRDRK